MRDGVTLLLRAAAEVLMAFLPAAAFEAEAIVAAEAAIVAAEEVDNAAALTIDVETIGWEVRYLTFSDVDPVDDAAFLLEEAVVVTAELANEE